jgi:hypothetical protein
MWAWTAFAGGSSGDVSVQGCTCTSGHEEAVAVTEPGGIQLRALLAEVVRTRAGRHKVRACRLSTPEDLHGANRESLHALERYALALDRLGWPMPARLRQELSLLRSTCGVSSVGSPTA